MIDINEEIVRDAVGWVNVACAIENNIELHTSYRIDPSTVSMSYEESTKKIVVSIGAYLGSYEGENEWSYTNKADFFYNFLNFAGGYFRSLHNEDFLQHIINNQ
jgi:S-methylmethionine-dependent homocysteine/selenocysteine methylase